jgi:hypothetical protein
MDLKIKDKDLFVRYFLQPIGKVSDSCCICVDQNVLSCIVSSPDNSIILNIKYSLNGDPINGSSLLNIPDIKKLIRAFDVIEEQSISIKIDKNNLSYKNNNISFKYHLLENGVINRPKINIDKINNINFDTTFYLTEKAFNDIIKASTFCVDSNKIYLYVQDGKVFGELTDRSRPNVDSFAIDVSSEYEGKDMNVLCLNLEIVRILSTNKAKQIKCRVNSELGVVLFEYGNNIFTTQYIVSSLTK